jgi:hypothetical protein
MKNPTQMPEVVYGTKACQPSLPRLVQTLPGNGLSYLAMVCRSSPGQLCSAHKSQRSTPQLLAQSHRCSSSAATTRSSPEPSAGHRWYHLHIGQRAHLMAFDIVADAISTNPACATTKLPTAHLQMDGCGWHMHPLPHLLHAACMMLKQQHSPLLQ